MARYQLAPLVAMLVQMAISRTREYSADKLGAQISRDPLALAGALKKLELSAPRIDNPIAALQKMADSHVLSGKRRNPWQLPS